MFLSDYLKVGCWGVSGALCCVFLDPADRIEGAALGARCGCFHAAPSSHGPSLRARLAARWQREGLHGPVDRLKGEKRHSSRCRAQGSGRAIKPACSPWPCPSAAGLCEEGRPRRARGTRQACGRLQPFTKHSARATPVGPPPTNCPGLNTKAPL